jgi:leucyl/phenylalanyl-tRNA---protein transferase
MIILPNTDDITFPTVDFADEETGLLAIGANLNMNTLVKAYNNGIFPWYNDDEPICWYCPRERMVLFAEDVVYSKSMQKIFKDEIFTFTSNQAFEQVISCCQKINRPNQDGTWITSEMQLAYSNLHKAGLATSVEVWQKGKLVGGLYGVTTQKHIFFGESMFSAVSNASKAALIWLCKKSDYSIIDCQVYTSHLQSMGAKLITRNAFINILKNNK